MSVIKMLRNHFRIKLNPKLMITVLALTFCKMSHADINTLKKFENEVIQKYRDAQPGSNKYYEVNQDIENIFSAQFAEDQSSFYYDFPKLQKQGYVHIIYSPDKKLKFYNFDVSAGGTMGEWTNYVQYRVQNQSKFENFESAQINHVKQVLVKNQIIYLVESYDKGSNCVGAFQLRAVQFNQQELLRAPIFHTKTQKLDEISVDFDCSKIPEHVDHVPEYLRISQQNIDVLLLDKNNVPQGKYLRYQLGNDGFKYVGIVK